MKDHTYEEVCEEKETDEAEKNKYTTFKRNINVKDQRYPCCIVWTQLPLISFLFPFIGHTGICTSDGRIYDFAGSETIGKDELAFGDPYKYVPLDFSLLYDKGLFKANEKFSHEEHSLFCNNCHSHVANALNNMNYQNRNNYNMISIWWMCLTKSKYVSWGHLIRNYLGWIIVICLFVFFYKIK